MTGGWNIMKIKKFFGRCALKRTLAVILVAVMLFAVIPAATVEADEIPMFHIETVVYDSDGNPTDEMVSGVLISINEEYSHELQMIYPEFAMQLPAITDVMGMITLHNVPVIDEPIWMNYDFIPEGYNYMEPLILETRNMTFATIKLQKDPYYGNGTITIRAVYTDDNGDTIPISGMNFQLMADDGTVIRVPSDDTDENGYTSFTNITDGTYSVTVFSFYNNNSREYTCDWNNNRIEAVVENGVCSIEYPCKKVKEGIQVVAYVDSDDGTTYLSDVEIAINGSNGDTKTQKTSDDGTALFTGCETNLSEYGSITDNTIYYEVSAQGLSDEYELVKYTVGDESYTDAPARVYVRVGQTEYTTVYVELKEKEETVNEEPEESTEPSEITVYKSADVAEDAPVKDASLGNETTDLKSLLSEEDITKVESGMKAQIYVKISQTTPTDDDDTKIKEAAKKEIGDSVTIKYMDVSLFKQIGDETAVKITEPGMKIKITLDMPDELLNTNSNEVRKYWIIKLHDGKTDVINGTFDEENKKFTFETDGFSTYAIAYTDTVKTAEAEKPTGENPTKAPSETPTTAPSGDDDDTDLTDDAAETSSTGTLVASENKGNTSTGAANATNTASADVGASSPKTADTANIPAMAALMALAGMLVCLAMKTWRKSRIYAEKIK
jgi:hypothetical protein